MVLGKQYKKEQAQQPPSMKPNGQRKKRTSLAGFLDELKKLGEKKEACIQQQRNLKERKKGKKRKRKKKKEKKTT